MCCSALTNQTSWLLVNRSLTWVQHDPNYPGLRGVLIRMAMRLNFLSIRGWAAVHHRRYVRVGRVQSNLRWIEACRCGSSLHRANVQGQNDELGELSTVKVVVADNDQRGAPVEKGRAKRHPLDVVDRDAKIVECEHLPL